MPLAVIRRFFLAAFVWFLLDSTGFIAWQAAGQAGAESATQNAAALLARAKEVMGLRAWASLLFITTPSPQRSRTTNRIALTRLFFRP